MSEITYRWIDGPTASQEEWDRIDDILAARGWMSLNRQLSRIRVAEQNGKLVGFFVFQCVPHTEPMWIIPSMRGTDVANKLADDMLNWLTEVRARGWMLVADNPVVAKMAEDRNMVKVESPVYRTR